MTYFMEKLVRIWQKWSERSVVRLNPDIFLPNNSSCNAPTERSHLMDVKMTIFYRRFCCLISSHQSCMTRPSTFLFYPSFTHDITGEPLTNRNISYIKVFGIMSVTKGRWRESNSQPSDYETRLLPSGHEMKYIKKIYIEMRQNGEYMELVCYLKFTADSWHNSRR
jgi:hypothetical protein